MAKLKDVVTPGELLELILGGAMKNEVIKKYKTSDQELAMMLLPLYRNGDLSKGDFNDFFKGIPLKACEEAAAEESRATTAVRAEDEAPSQILKSLDVEAEAAPAEAEAYAEEETELDMDLAAAAKPMVEAVPSSEDEHAAAEKLHPQELQFQAQALPPSSEEQVSPMADRNAAPVDSGSIASLLDMIFAKLNSIDARLSQIEKKLNLL